MLFGTLDTENSPETLRQALSLVDYDNIEVILPFRGTLRPIILEVLKAKGFKTTEDRANVLHYVSHKDALNWEVTDLPNFEIKKLSVEHAKMINDLWRGRSRESLILIERLIRHDHSLGIFNEKNELIAWIMRRENGSCGIFQVIEKYRNQGLGTLLSKKFAKHLAEMGIDTFGSIFPQNFGSNKIATKFQFSKLGEDVRMKIQRNHKL